MKIDSTPPTEFYLSIIPHRNPVQKLHATIGPARGAITYRVGWRSVLLHEEIEGIRTGHTRTAYPVQAGQVWHWSAGEWRLVHDIVDGTLDVRLPWRKEAEQYKYYVQD